MVVDRVGGTGDQFSEFPDYFRPGLYAAVPVEVAAHMVLGFRGPQRNRRNRPQGHPDPAGAAVHKQGQGRNRDDHCVARADLAELLGAVEYRNPHGLDQLSGHQAGRLDTGDELGDGHLAAGFGRTQFQHGVEGGQHGNAVTGGRGGCDVSTEGCGVADLWGADGAGGLGQRRHQRRNLRFTDLGKGDTGAESQFVSCEMPVGEFGNPVEGDHVFDASTAPVDLDHEVGSAGNDDRVGFCGQGSAGIFEGGSNGHRHSAMLSSVQHFVNAIARANVAVCQVRYIPSLQPWPRSLRL